MTKYRVCMQEVHIQVVEIEASSIDEAKDLVEDGAGDYKENYYSHTHNSNMDRWLVEEVE